MRENRTFTGRRSFDCSSRNSKGYWLLGKIPLFDILAVVLAITISLMQLTA